MQVEPTKGIFLLVKIINKFGIILVLPHGLEVNPFLSVRFAQPLSELHTSRTAAIIYWLCVQSKSLDDFTGHHKV